MDFQTFEHVTGRTKSMSLQNIVMQKQIIGFIMEVNLHETSVYNISGSNGKFLVILYLK